MAGLERTQARSVTVRPIASDDRDLVFIWRNTPKIVALSSSGCGVTQEQHDRWFEATLNSPDRLTLIVEEAGVPAGLVRFDRDRDQAVVSIYLVAAETRRGVGSAAITLAVDALTARWPNCPAIRANVLDSNSAARRFFAANSFVETDDMAIPHHVSLCRVLS
jgi:RimJ/RimL family protein N-acetyltransferase